MSMLLRKIARHIASIAELVLLGGLLSATLVRLAPGFDADERELDPNLNAESLRAVRAEHAANRNILRYMAIPRCATAPAAGRLWAIYKDATSYILGFSSLRHNERRRWRRFAPF